MLRRLRNPEINKDKWDEVVAKFNHPVYMLSWYLDVVSPQWECLALGNYQNIMPLPLKRKWRIPYLVQPPFCQKIGIMGPEGLVTASLIYKYIFRHFPYVNLLIRNKEGLKKVYLKQRINYTLDLSASYPALVKGYRGNSIRNIRKAQKACLFVTQCEADEFVAFGQLWFKGMNKEQSSVFSSLIRVSHERNIAKLVKVTSPDGEILAAACFMIWNKQILNLVAASSPSGKKASAMFLVLDTIIKEYAGSGYTLDFEGSMLPGVASFFEDFGGVPGCYYHLKKHW